MAKDGNLSKEEIELRKQAMKLVEGMNKSFEVWYKEIEPELKNILQVTYINGALERGKYVSG
jgi:hypothetical protein